MRHRWPRDHWRRLAADDFQDGCARTFRICEHCGLQKVTVHPPQGFPWHEFVSRDGVKSLTMPVCAGELDGRH